MKNRAAFKNMKGYGLSFVNTLFQISLPFYNKILYFLGYFQIGLLQS